MRRAGQPSAEDAVINGIVTSDAISRGRIPAAQGRRLRSIVVITLIVGFCLAVAGALVRLAGLPEALTPHSSSAQVSTQQVVANAQNALQRSQTASEKGTAYFRLGEAYMSNGQYDQAVTAYTSALTTDPALQTTVLPSLANAYAASGHTSQAISALQTLISILTHSTDPQAQRLVTSYQTKLQLLQGTPAQP